MKKLLTFAMILFLISSLHAQERKTYSLSNFTGVKLGGSSKVYLKKGSEQRVEAEGSEDALEILELTVKNGTLHIGQKPGMRSWKGYKSPDIYITIPELDAASISGSGSIIGESTFKSRSMDISISGSGKINLDLDANDLEVKISGSGRAELSGKAKTHRFTISGSGKIDAEGLESEESKVVIAGSGSITNHVTKRLDVTISGSGSLRYKGDPEHLNSKASGSGKVRKL